MILLPVTDPLTCGSSSSCLWSQYIEPQLERQTQWLVEWGAIDTDRRVFSILDPLCLPNNPNDKIRLGKVRYFNLNSSG